MDPASRLKVIVVVKPAIQIPAPATTGTTKIIMAASVSPDTILITANKSSTGAAKSTIQPIKRTNQFLITILG
jgi:hypothetical protein